jgi:hypothetical protein
VDETAAVIRNQMDQTRSDLSDQIGRLENRVTDDLTSTGAAVTEMFGTVRETFVSVRDFVDIRAHIVRHPWMAFGGAVAVGYLVARRPVRTTVAPAIARQIPPSPAQLAVASEPRRQVEPAPNAPSSEGVWEILTSVMRQTAARATPIMLDYLTAVLQVEPTPRDNSIPKPPAPFPDQPRQDSRRENSRPPTSLPRPPRHG